MLDRTHTLRLAALAVVALACAGCRVSEKNDGKNKTVDVTVPFANVHVNTTPDPSGSGIGLTVYPGAVPVKEGDGDTDTANVSMSFGSFHLGVKAASFQTPDAPAKVEAFYRNDLKRYGDVIECRGDQPVGQPTRTSSGLTCSDHGGAGSSHTGHGVQLHGHIGNSDDDKSPELRAGSPQHFHVVSFEPKNGGTKIGLVLLDLPEDHNDNASE